MPVTRTTLFEAARRPSPASEPGRRDERRRSGEDAERIDALQRLEQAFGRELVVDPGENRRLLHCATQVGLAREVEEHGPDRPAQDDAGGGAEQKARDRVDRAQPRHSARVVRSTPPRRPATPRRSVPPSTAPASATSGA